MAIRELSSDTELGIGEPATESATICVECQTPIPDGRVFHERGEPKHRNCLLGWMV